MLRKLRKRRRAGWYVGDSGEGRKGDDPFGCTSWRATVMSTTRSLGRDPLTAHWRRACEAQQIA